MNNYFNLKRFGWLLRKTLLERPAQLSGLALLSITLSFVTYALLKATSSIEDAQIASFMIGLIGGGCFLASFVYSHFATGASGVSFLCLPASQFEKWLCGVFITGICFTTLFLIFFRVIDSSFIAIYHHSLDPQAPFYKERYDAVKLFPLNGFVADKTYMIFLNFGGGMLVGSLYFNRAVFIKVALITCGICLGIFLLNFLIATFFFANVQTAFPYYLVWIWVGKERGRLELPENTQAIISLIFHYILPAILWSLAYLRLREKEF